jgi:hypothetical protein
MGIIDATECPIERPTGYAMQYSYYSGKKKKHTVKYELVFCPHRHIILWVAGGVGGAVYHDLALAQAGLLNRAPTAKFLADKGYIGDEHFVVPLKQFRDREFTQAEENYNMNINRMLVLVEQLIGRFKKFQCLKAQWRHPREMGPIVFGVIAEIVNIDVFFHPLVIKGE